MELLQVNQSKTLLPELMPLFKEHLRILHDDEDVTIEMYLDAATEAIGIFAGTEIYSTLFEVLYDSDKYNYAPPSSIEFWHCGKERVHDLHIFNAAGVDITDKYQVIPERGLISPHPQGNKVVFSTGYERADDIPANIKVIILRYASSLFENRESSRVGDLKLLPDWLNYAIASIWTGRA